MVHGQSTDEASLAKDYENFDGMLGLVEKKFLGENAFMCGGEISIADICAVSEVRNREESGVGELNTQGDAFVCV